MGDFERETSEVEVRRETLFVVEELFFWSSEGKAE